MEHQTFSILVTFAVLVPLFVAGVNIGATLAIAGIVGTYVETGSFGPGINMLLLQAIDVSGSYSLMVIPLFIALGTLASAAGITTDLFNAFYRWIGRISGGIAVATIATCAAMASITGSSVATSAAMSRIAWPELKRYNYSPELSVGAICVGGTVAIMIPPSITLVIYGIFAEQSIGKLLIAGILPGLLISALYAIKIVIRCRISPELGPAGPRFTLREQVEVMPSVLPFLGIVASILVGMLTGIWTPVEAAAVGVMMVLLLGTVRRRFTLRGLARAFIDGVVTSASVLLVVIGSLVFSNYLALNGISEAITQWIVGLDLAPFVLFCAFMLVYFILGMLMEVTSILALTIPLTLPAVIQVGWDPIWYGVVLVCMMEVAAVTPPVGLNLYAVKASIPEVSLETIYRGSILFWLVNILAVYIFYFFPEIVLYLPGLM
ncbi:MAG: TRAP transporter large permease [Alphaproteobacteria bacterium]|nr:TRAP transporter large permease [Alphaproteobacteria bacterium]